MPIIKITSSEKGNNKGSSRALVHYLEKENNDKPKDEHEQWFNNKSESINYTEVLLKIDSNKKGLKNNEAKFYLVNISPSQKELKFLIENFGKENLKTILKNYSNNVMHAYAKNFQRKTISSSEQLLYFGKIEESRYFKHNDIEVINGDNNKGDKKDGENWHAQIIVSRKDVSQRISLSPLNNSSGRNPNHSSAFGQFNMVNLKIESEKIFDSMFDYNREPHESFLFLNTQKNGDIKARASLLVTQTFARTPIDLTAYLSRNLDNEFLSAIGTLFMNSPSAVRSSEQESELSKKKRQEKIIEQKCLR